MASITIPFNKGVHEEADAKLLPQGLFTVAQNVRSKKDGRIAVRNAYRHDTTNAAFSEANVLGVGKFDQQHHLILQKRLGDDQPPAWARHLGSTYAAGTSWTGAVATQQAGSVGVPALLPIKSGTMANLVDQVASSDSLVIGGFLFVVVCAYKAGTTKAPSQQIGWFNGYALLLKIDPGTGAVLKELFFTADVASNAKLVNINGNIGIFWADDADHVRFFSCDTTNLTTLVVSTTVITTVAGIAQYFDVCTGATATTTWLVYNSAANQLSFGDVSTAGVFAIKSTIATTNNSRPGIARRGLNSTDDVVIIWNDGAAFATGTTKYTIFRRSTGLFPTATTNLTTFYTTASLGYPLINESSLDDWTAAWNTNVSNTTPPCDAMWQTTAGQTPHVAFGVYAVSKPFTFGASNFIGIVTADQKTVPAFPGIITAGSYYLYDNDTPAGAADPTCEGVFAISQATPFDTSSSTDRYVENRRTIQAVTAAGIEPALSGAAMVALPLTSDERGGWGLVRWEYGQYEEMFQTAALNGQLHVSGSRILQYDGGSLVESGFPVPVIVSATPSAAAGSIPNGTFSLVAVYEWYDALGNRHLSPPSLPVSAVMAGANNTLTVIVSPPAASVRDLANVTLNVQSKLSVRIYRTTLTTNTVYQDGAGVINTGFGSFQSGFSVVLTAADATVATQEVLYTQGVRGGLSGVLQNDRPPPARYIWAGSDRLIIGHTDSPTQYQLSKLKFSGEPITWSNTAAYSGNVDKPITGVAEMDGTYFIGTRDAIWTVSGQGPDDNGGGGTFDTPHRLPSDAGFYSGGSLVLTGAGLFFQGAVDRIYVLPRGGGTPQWVGQPVRDTLASFPWVTSAAYDEDSSLVYFACVNTAGTQGRLLVYDTRINEWFVDNVLNRAIRSLAILNGLLVIDGSIIESTTSWQDSDGSSTASVLPVLTTGDIRPFGQAGWGRFRKAQILGESRDVSVAWSMTLEVSYDSGKTFGETATWARASLGTAIGDAFDMAEHYFVTQKADSVRLRLSMTTPSATEGLVFNGLVLEVYGAPGTKRNPNSLKAA